MAAPPRRLRAVTRVLLLLCLSHAATRATAQGIPLGNLPALQHQVDGDVFAVDSRTLRIENFNYDGLGPAAVFWADLEPGASRDGVRVPFQASCDAPGRLDRADGTETVVLELPRGYEFGNLRHFSVWCELANVSFGGIDIPEVIDGLESRAQGDCDEPTPTPVPAEEPFPVPAGWNCDPLTDDFQVRWGVDGENVNIELVARVTEQQYMGFGPSGEDDRTYMVGADAAIAYRTVEGLFTAIDFHMSSRQPCNEGDGVCPDVDVAGTPGNDDLTNISGDRDGGLTMVRYTRPLAASDDNTDRPISLTEPTFVAWAIGPLGDGLPLFHSGDVNFPRSNVSVDFGREASNSCEQLLARPETDAVPGFIRPSLINVTDITARIGPAGGVRGVQGITMAGSWGIAWYLSPTGTSGEDILVPVVAVERGKTYTFRVNGGVDMGDGTIFHPLYITDSDVGGYNQRTPAVRAMENVFAGIDVLEEDDEGGVVSFNATASGALCQIEDMSNSTEGTANIETFQEYYESLNTSCATDSDITDAAGVLEWTVPLNAPDVLYYQCVTHPFLGFKIGVFDDGQIDQAEVARLSGGASLQASDETPTCVVTFKGEERSFDGCRRDLVGGVEVYWNFREEVLETLFRARTNGGYVGFGWGYEQMEGSNAAIAFELNGEAVIDDYFLETRSTAGVQPNTNQNLMDMDADLDDEGFMIGVFSRPRVQDGIPTIQLGPTLAIWAVGSMPSSRTSLVQHGGGERASTTIDLADVTGGNAAQNSGFDTIFSYHAVLMGIAWYVLVPSAIITMRYFRKFNPVSFQIHRAFNSLAVIVALIAFIMGVARGSHTETAHLVIGSIAVGLAVLQFASGWLRPHKGTSARKVWFAMHALAGSIAIGLSQTNGFIGIGILEPGKGWYYVLGFAVGIYVFLHVVLSFMPKKFPVVIRDEAEGGPEQVASHATGSEMSPLNA